MSEPETHYVLIVHGTWNAPTADAIKWYQKGGAFAEALAQRLEGTSLAGAVWRRCRSTPTDFAWNGDNTHEARLNAAKQLCAKMLSIRAADPTARIHLIAHSHGGNVVLKALEHYFNKIHSEGLEFARRYNEYARDSNCQLSTSEILTRALAEAYPDWPQGRRDAVTEKLPSLLGESNSFYKVSEAGTQSGNRDCARRHLRIGPPRRVFEQWASVSLPPNAAGYLLDDWKWAHWNKNNPALHHIGRLIFLGTPFLHKRWHRHGWRSWLPYLIDALSFLPTFAIFFGLIFYGYVMAGAILAFLLGMSFVSVSPLGWPAWLQISYCLILLGAISPGLIDSITSRPEDNNLYHTPGFWGPMSTGLRLTLFNLWLSPRLSLTRR